MMDERAIWDLLDEVPDPEIPVISVVELGVIRDVKVDRDVVEIKITPTYIGCPALHVFEDDIIKKLKESGFNEIKISKVYAPAWTTDWLSEDAKRKLKESGIAPPENKTTDKATLLGSLKEVECPYCQSKNTTLTSQFGSTACKSLHFCEQCVQPFEHFKCH